MRKQILETLTERALEGMDNYVASRTEWTEDYEKLNEGYWEGLDDTEVIENLKTALNHDLKATQDDLEVLYSLRTEWNKKGYTYNDIEKHITYSIEQIVRIKQAKRSI